MSEGVRKKEPGAMTRVKKVGGLSFGRGRIGQDFALEDSRAETQFADNLARYTAALVKTNTADCGDERRTLRLANGTQDPAILRGRIVPEVFGGLVLATTKAAVAAGASYLERARDFINAYEIIYAMLTHYGYEDGGHKSCGASATVESSVSHPIEPDALYEAVGLFTPIDSPKRLLLDGIQQTKKRSLESGFYGTWGPQWHEGFLTRRVPHNFSYLADDPGDHETHGHHASGIYVVTRATMGFAKNAFIEGTGQESFGLTVPLMQEISRKLGETAEEQVRMELAFYDDALHVGAGLVMPGMPVFAQAA